MYENFDLYFSWLDLHKKLALLNQQSVLEITGLREESVMEWFLSLKKVKLIVRDASIKKLPAPKLYINYIPLDMIIKL